MLHVSNEMLMGDMYIWTINWHSDKSKAMGRGCNYTPPPPPPKQSLFLFCFDWFCFCLFFCQQTTASELQSDEFLFLFWQPHFQKASSYTMVLSRTLWSKRVLKIPLKHFNFEKLLEILIVNLQINQ